MRAASGFLMGREANNTVATSAVPKAAPIERENCTEAAASPRRNWPAALCTLTCTTPITVPMHSPMHSSSPASAGVPSEDAQKARTTKLAVNTERPPTGEPVVIPVLLTSRPVSSDPVPIPMVSGTSMKPVSDGDAPPTPLRGKPKQRVTEKQEEGRDGDTTH